MIDDTLTAATVRRPHTRLTRTALFALALAFGSRISEMMTYTFAIEPVSSIRARAGLVRHHFLLDTLLDTAQLLLGTLLVTANPLTGASFTLLLVKLVLGRHILHSHFFIRLLKEDDFILEVGSNDDATATELWLCEEEKKKGDVCEQRSTESNRYQ